MDSIKKNEIYQFSLVNALMAGAASHGITVAELTSKGNHGLGTFQYINGELIHLDDKVYQLRGDGSIRVAEPTEVIPYAATTPFEAEHSRKVKIKNKYSIDEILRTFNDNAGNLFMSYRVEGRFKHLKCRTVRGQEYEGQPLPELGKKQSEETWDNIEGTIVGFFSPENWQGFCVAGDHQHFIDKDRKLGGHVLELETDEEVLFAVATVNNIHIQLPTSRQFNQAELVTDDAGLRAVEG